MNVLGHCTEHGDYRDGCAYCLSAHASLLGASGSYRVNPETDALRQQLAGAVAAADALLAAYDQSGLTDLRWFVPYVEALREAVHPTGGQ